VLLMIGKTVVAVVAGTSILASVAVAEDVVVSQKDKAFSEKKISVKVGDTISFVNDDDITHNVYSRSKGHKFDIGAQRPGTSVSHQFSAPGKVKVRCAIHPRMKLTVNVE
jgi:plastocyanin